MWCAEWEWYLREAIPSSSLASEDFVNFDCELIDALGGKLGHLLIVGSFWLSESARIPSH